MRHCTCGPRASWCARTDELFGAEADFGAFRIRDITRIGDWQSVTCDRCHEVVRSETIEDRNRASLVAILPSMVGRRVGGARGYSSLGQRSRRPQRQDDSRGLVPRVGLLRHGFGVFRRVPGEGLNPPDRGSRASVITVPSQAHQFLVETGSSSEHPRACGWQATQSERCRTAHRQLVSPSPQSNRRAETFRQTSPRRGHPPGAVSSRRRH